MSKGYPKSTQGHHLRLIVSSRGAVTYGVSKELGNIFRLLVGHPQPHEEHTGFCGAGHKKQT